MNRRDLVKMFALSPLGALFGFGGNVEASAKVGTVAPPVLSMPEKIKRIRRLWATDPIAFRDAVLPDLKFSLSDEWFLKSLVTNAETTTDLSWDAISFAALWFFVTREHPGRVVIQGPSSYSICVLAHIRWMLGIAKIPLAQYLEVDVDHSRIWLLSKDGNRHPSSFVQGLSNRDGHGLLGHYVRNPGELPNTLFISIMDDDAVQPGWGRAETWAQRMVRVVNT